MIHVVTSANALYYEQALDEMFRLRHEFYVRMNGWTELDRGDGLERDEFDTDQSVYLLYLDEEDRLLGSYRLCPSLGPNLLFDKFGDWIDDETAARGPEIWDLSRWFLTDRARKTHPELAKPVQDELSCAIFEFALSRRISAYTMFSEARFFEFMLRAGWPVRPLGMPRPYDDKGNAAMALRLETSREALEHNRRVTGVFRPVMFEAPPPVDGCTLRTALDAARLMEAAFAVASPKTRAPLMDAARLVSARAIQTAH